MKSHNFENTLIALMGFLVFFTLFMGAERAVGAPPNQSQVFCLSVVAKTQDMLQLPWPERVKALSALKESDPVLAQHVVPATGAATRAWIHGSTTTKIMTGIYHACRQQVQDS